MSATMRQHLRFPMRGSIAVGLVAGLVECSGMLLIRRISRYR
jgi:hypothetical protein